MNPIYDINKITNYLKRYSNQLPKLYKWNVKLDKLVELGVLTPVELNNLQQKTPFEKEVVLKNKIKIKLNKVHDDGNILFDKLCMWIIKDWGGIRGANNEATLQLVYKFIEDETCDFNRIASISKVASYMYPDRYCIYDSRVAYALNWILLSQNAGTKFFPIPEGRNSKMIAFDMKVLIRLCNINKYATTNVSDMDERLFVKNRDKHIFIPKNEAYDVLNSLIKQVSKELWDDDSAKYLYYTEMLLFSIADSEILNDITNSTKLSISENTIPNQQPKYITVYEQIKEYCDGKKGQVILTSATKQELNTKYGTNPESILLSDYCYNRINNGIAFDKHLFEFIGNGQYKVLGENYPYTGEIYHKSKELKEEYVVGKWTNGGFILFDNYK